MKYSLIKIGVLALVAAAISACGGDDDDDGPTATPNPTTAPTSAGLGLSTSVLDESHRFDAPASQARISVVASTSISGALDYNITLTNLSNAQPMSPVLVVLHGGEYQSFDEGETASLALESMAEGGDTSSLITEAMSAADYLAHQSTSGAIGPKSSQQLSFTVEPESSADLHITMLSMLVNTNDAFTGLNARDISQLSMGSSATFAGAVWDAGTEANSEAAGTMPGPADGGEGFNPARTDPIDKVRIHSGVVTNALAEGIISD